MSQLAPDLPQPDATQPYEAGDIESFSGGKIIYLSPTPLPKSV